MLLPVYAIVSGEPYLQSLAMADLLTTAGPNMDRRDFEGDQAELADVLDELRSFSMFAAAKVVVVRDADDFLTRFRPALEDYVSAPSDSGTLVLRLSSLPATQRIHKMIKQKGKVITSEPPKERDLPAWIIARAKSAHAVTVQPQAAQILAGLIGADLGRLDSELGKLALVCEKQTVTPDTVRHAVSFQREQEMWDLTNMLSTGDITATITRWRQLLTTDSSAEFRAVTWLTLWLQKLLRAHPMVARRVPPDTIARDLKIWPASQIDGILRMAARLGDEGLRGALDRLVEADIRSKSGLGDGATNVEAFLLSLATPTNPRP